MKYTTPLLFDKTMDIFRLIYDRSRFSDRYDLFRMKDICDSFSKGQVQSKEWLVEKVLPYVEDYHQSILIIGGWYGLLSHIFAEKGFKKEIKNYELDDVCIELAQKLQVHKNIMHKHEDGLELFDHPRTNKKEKIVCCTACEHIDPDDLYSVLSMKAPKMIVALQSNNMYDIDSHINCHDSLSSFVASLPEMEILYQGTLTIGEYQRFMVIAR